MASIPPGPPIADRPPEPETTISAPTFSAAPTRPAILYGPDGLRAGWSILAFLGILALFLALARFEVSWLARHLHQGAASRRGHELHPTLMILAETSVLLAVLLATAIMARLEQRRTASYGLEGTNRVRQFLIGLVSGFGFLSLLIAILMTTHHIELARSTIGLGSVLRYAAAWGVCFLVVALTEETMVRGYLLFTLARGIRFWPAAFVLAALFGLLHKGNGGESPFGLVAAALVALVFSLSLWRLGHLWWAIGFHTAWDWAESFFYGTADSGTVSAGRLMHAHPIGSLLSSGGPTGPEGSVWIVPVLVLAAGFVWFTQPTSTSQFRSSPGFAKHPSA
jgi:membrane protease YdiL (CAAX protease family)